MAEPGEIIIDEKTHNLVTEEVNLAPYKTLTPKGFARPVNTFKVRGFKAPETRNLNNKLSRTGKRVEINVIDSSDIRAALEELKQIQDAFEKEYAEKLEKK